MANQGSILSFDSVSTAKDLPAYDLPMLNVSLALDAGELALFRFDRHAPRTVLPDAAMGLVEIASGSVRFMGDDWQRLSPGRAAERRGEIGRFFGTRGWVFHLDVDENITLSQRHHTRRPLAEIEHEANELAVTIGLKTGMPQVRPSLADAHDLQKCSCVRLLLGSPRLLIIDEPPTGLFSDVLSMLKPQIERLRNAGSAVLWMSADPAVWDDTAIKSTYRTDVS
jgi:phospholipid/cholesterol/gamma-HCH transport system ATP-binding protein